MYLRSRCSWGGDRKLPRAHRPASIAEPWTSVLVRHLCLKKPKNKKPVCSSTEEQQASPSLSLRIRVPRYTRGQTMTKYAFEIEYPSVPSVKWWIFQLLTVLLMLRKSLSIPVILCVISSILSFFFFCHVEASESWKQVIHLCSHHRVPVSEGCGQDAGKQMSLASLKTAVV